jgi:hypothetical protein
MSSNHKYLFSRIIDKNSEGRPTVELTMKFDVAYVLENGKGELFDKIFDLVEVSIIEAAISHNEN